jgi:hypothetical protein
MVMALGGLIKRLFGGGDGTAPSAGSDRSRAVDYKGYTIIPTPRPHGGQYLTAAIIEKPGETAPLVHELVRADTHGSPDDAAAFAVQKAKQVIDEQGDRLFG